MTVETKPFPTQDVISAITGYLIGDMGGVYQVLNWMTDSSVYTHQIPRISREAWPAVLALHPHLAVLEAEASQVTPDNVLTWRDAWIDRYGPEIAVPRLTDAQHERIDPLSELVETVHPSRIVVLDPGDGSEPNG